MRKNIFWSAILALSMPLSLLTSCQSDDGLVDGRQDGKGASISLDVNYPGFGENTRTSLEEIDGNMIGNWAEGDRLLITDAGGNNVGSLELTNGVGTKHATFTGHLSSAVQDGTHEFTFTYLGAGVQIDEISSSAYILNFSSQDGDYTKLNRYDVFSGKGQYTVVNGTSYAKEALQFKKLLALAHFKLMFPENVSLTNGKVEISGENLKSSADINLANGTLTNSTDGSISVSSTNGDFYITMIPAEGVKPVFKVNIDGTEYEGILNARTWNAGEFVRQGHQEGVPVTMEKVEDDSGEFIDLGLTSGTLWASKNIGADEPYEFGNYYGWGDVTGTKTVNSASSYGPSNYANAPSSTENSYGTTYYWQCCATDANYSSYDIAAPTR